MLRPHLLLPLLLIACKSSGGSGSAPPAVAGSDAMVAPSPAEVKQPTSAPGPAPVPAAVPYQEVIVGRSLPDGQILQLGGPRWSHPAMADQVLITSTGAVASASASHVRLWDEASRALRWQVFTPSGRTRFALSSDEKWIAIAQGDFDRARVSVYELGGALRVGFKTGSVTAMAFSPDGTKLAVAGTTVSIHDAATGKLLINLKGLAFAVGFSADGQLIAVGKDGVKRWSGTGDTWELVASFPSSSRGAAVNLPVTAAAWGNGTALEMTKLEGAPTKIAAAAPAPITSIALAAGGAVALVGWAGGIAAWDLGPSPTKRWQLETRVKSQPAMAFASSGKVVVASDARGVFTLDAATGKELVAKEDRIRFAGFAADGNLVVFKGSTHRIVDVRTGAYGAEHDLPAGAPASADSVLYGANGLAVAWDSGAQGECKPLTVWLSGKGVRTLPPPSGCRDTPWMVGPGFVVADGSKTTIWDLVENKPRLILPATPRPRIGLAFSADRRWMVAAYGAADSTSSNHDQGTLLAVFDLTAAKATGPALHLRELEWTEPAGLRAVTILADGTVIAGTVDGIVYKARPEATTFEKVTELGAEVVLLDASPSGKAVAATNEDGLTAILEP